MIHVSISIHPYGDADMTQSIATLTIANVGGPESSCCYEAKLVHDGNTRYATVHHDRGKGAVVLATKALAAFGARA